MCQEGPVQGHSVVSPGMGQAALAGPESVFICLILSSTSIPRDALRPSPAGASYVRAITQQLRGFLRQVLDATQGSGHDHYSESTGPAALGGSENT